MQKKIFLAFHKHERKERKDERLARGTEAPSLHDIRSEDTGERKLSIANIQLARRNGIEIRRDDAKENSAFVFYAYAF